MPATVIQLETFGTSLNSVWTFSLRLFHIIPIAGLTVGVNPVRYGTWQAAGDCAIDRRYWGTEAAW